MDCVICKRPLKGAQQKYCGESCKVYNKIEVARKLRLKLKKKIPPKICIVCNKSFSPKRLSHAFCSIKCRDKFNISSRKEARHKRGLRPQIRPMDFLRSDIPENLETHSIPIFNQNCSQNKNQILEFLKNGGKITKFRSATAGKTPDVNTVYAWIPEDLIDSSLFYEMGDEE